MLLVDDLSDTGWTLAAASRLLRRAGAEGVFPLVLAVQACDEASSVHDLGRDIRVIPADSRQPRQLLVAACRYAREN